MLSENPGLAMNLLKDLKRSLHMITDVTFSISHEKRA